MYRKKKSKGKTKIRTKLIAWSVVLVLMAAIAVADVDHGLAETNLWANVSVAQMGAGDNQVSMLQNGTIPVFRCEENFGVRKAAGDIRQVHGSHRRVRHEPVQRYVSAATV